MTASTPSTVIRSTLAKSHGAQELAIKLLRSRKTPDFNAGAILSSASSSFKKDGPAEFYFYNYACRYWLHHILLTSELGDTLSKEFGRMCKLVKGGIYRERSMMLRLVEKAAQTGQHRIILLMQDIGWLDFDVKGEEGRTPLAWAALGHHTKTAEALLGLSPDVETKDFNGQTPLSLSIGLTTLYPYRRGGFKSESE
jgi:hypothetical protein